MKPTTPTSRQSDRLGQERTSFRPGSNQPLIDYHFRSDTAEREFGGTLSQPQETEALPVLAPGFCTLSNEFFRGEAKRLYVMEVLLFAIIVAISAWPIAFMIETLRLTV